MCDVWRVSNFNVYCHGLVLGREAKRGRRVHFFLSLTLNRVRIINAKPPYRIHGAYSVNMTYAQLQRFSPRWHTFGEGNVIYARHLGLLFTMIMIRHSDEVTARAD